LRLSELVPAEAVLDRRGSGDPVIEDLAYDSRRVGPKTLFAALKGGRSHGLEFLSDAVRNGAAALLLDEAPSIGWPPFPGPVLNVADARKTLGWAAHRFFGMPSEKMALIGVTGTNGKTTTTYLLESMLTAAGHRVGVIGTIGYRYPGASLPAPATTPESVDLQRLLARMSGSGVTHSVMEVSSHALRQSRVAGCRFCTVLFTNLSRDHLDYHRDMDDYFAAKKLLFQMVLGTSETRISAPALSNADDPYGRELIQAFPRRIRSYGMVFDSDYSGTILRSDMEGFELLLKWKGNSIRLRSPLVGRLNAMNVLAAAAAALAMGVPPDAVQEGAVRVERVPGRMEWLRGDRGEWVVVDYAHTPEAMEKVLDAIQGLSPRKVVTVFGCGGDRDRGKRPLMGVAAAERSSAVIITSDNPRSEEPEAVIRDIETGVNAAGLVKRPPAPGLAEEVGWYAVEPDRRKAIQWAVALAGPSDVVLVAGKGHETDQIVGSQRLHFDDTEEVREALKRKAGPL